MAGIDDVPLIDAEPAADREPRRITFEAPAVPVRRRGFMAVVGAAATTLGVTALGWIPLARPARADPGTEHPDCGRYFDGPGGPLCRGYPYSPDHCGADGWFRDGCVTGPDGYVDCYRPLTICWAGEYASSGWRWEAADGTVWRCADGEVQYQGAPNPERVICSARLSGEPIPAPTPSPTTTLSPTPSPPPALPVLPSLTVPVPPLQPVRPPRIVPPLPRLGP